MCETYDYNYNISNIVFLKTGQFQLIIMIDRIVNFDLILNLETSKNIKKKRLHRVGTYNKYFQEKNEGGFQRSFFY